MSKIETTSKVSLKLTSRINLRRWEARTKPWILDAAHMTPTSPPARKGPISKDKSAETHIGDPPKTATTKSYHRHQNRPKTPFPTMMPKTRQQKTASTSLSSPLINSPPKHNPTTAPRPGHPTGARITTK